MSPRIWSILGLNQAALAASDSWRFMISSMFALVTERPALRPVRERSDELR